MTNCSNKILVASRKYFNTKHFPLVEAATRSYVSGNYSESLAYLSQLPDDKDLLASLVEKCRTKPVYSNLKKIFNNESVSKIDTEIAMSSLITRCLIEARDNSEYRALLPDLHKKLGDLIA